MFDNTIVAISTPFGESGIGIIRLSGNESFVIADKIFRRTDKKCISDLPDHSINYGWIIDPRNEEIIDEVLLSILKRPRTYTREDMIEINCHGGWVALNRTMDLTLYLGARIALPGEFTKRAFMNGRIDLTQAEAILDIIRARNESGLYSAVKKLKGSIRNKIGDIRNRLFRIFYNNNAIIEFEKQVSIEKEIEQKILDEILRDIEAIIDRYDRRQGEGEGIKTVICGKTNVGKSSIINTLYGEERILTSSIAGTTRDSIRIDIFLDGIIYQLVDTAGIKEGRTHIEKLSIRNTKKEIKNCDCLIMVFDLSRKINSQDKRIVKWIKGLGKDIVWVANKKDLPLRINLKELGDLVKGEKIFKVSAGDGSGMDQIISELKKKKRKFSQEIVDGLLINKRQKRHLDIVKDALIRARNLIQEGLGEELISEEIRYAIEELDNLIGKRNESNSIEKIFDQFCIGK